MSRRTLNQTENSWWDLVDAGLSIVNDGPIEGKHAAAKSHHHTTARAPGRPASRRR
jgi:hypothetical protein